VKILFDTTSVATERSVMFFVANPVELRLWQGDAGDVVQIWALLVDSADPRFQLSGCDVVSAQYVPSPIAEMQYAVCGKLKELTTTDRMIYITRPGWYKAIYVGSGIGDSIVDMEERNQVCECC